MCLNHRQLAWREQSLAEDEAGAGVCIAMRTGLAGIKAHLSRKWSPTLGRQAKCQGRALRSRPALRTWMLLPTWSYLHAQGVQPVSQAAVTACRETGHTLMSRLPREEGSTRGR